MFIFVYLSTCFMHCTAVNMVCHSFSSTFHHGWITFSLYLSIYFVCICVYIVHIWVFASNHYNTGIQNTAKHITHIMYVCACVFCLFETLWSVQVGANWENSYQHYVDIVFGLSWLNAHTHTLIYPACSLERKRKWETNSVTWQKIEHINSCAFWWLVFACVCFVYVKMQRAEDLKCIFSFVSLIELSISRCILYA